MSALFFSSYFYMGNDLFFPQWTFTFISSQYLCWRSFEDIFIFSYWLRFCDLQHGKQILEWNQNSLGWRRDQIEAVVSGLPLGHKGHRRVAGRTQSCVRISWKEDKVGLSWHWEDAKLKVPSKGALFTWWRATPLPGARKISILRTQWNCCMWCAN